MKISEIYWDRGLFNSKQNNGKQTAASSTRLDSPNINYSERPEKESSIFQDNSKLWDFSVERNL